MSDQRGFHARVVVAGLGIFGAMCSSAQPRDCGEIAGPEMSNAKSAIERWAVVGKTSVPGSVQAVILSDVCKSIASILAEDPVKAGRISAASRNAIPKYLDRLADPDKRLQSMEAVYRTELGAAGFAQPQIKRWGRVKIDYTRDVDYINAAGDEMRPAPAAILLLVGPRTIAGFKRSSQVCKGDVIVSATLVEHFKC